MQSAAGGGQKGLEDYNPFAEQAARSQPVQPAQTVMLSWTLLNSFIFLSMVFVLDELIEYDQCLIHQISCLVSLLSVIKYEEPPDKTLTLRLLTSTFLDCVWEKASFNFMNCLQCSALLIFIWNVQASIFFSFSKFLMLWLFNNHIESHPILQTSPTPVYTQPATIEPTRAEPPPTYAAYPGSAVCIKD